MFFEPTTAWNSLVCWEMLIDSRFHIRGVQALRPKKSLNQQKNSHSSRSPVSILTLFCNELRNNIESATLCTLALFCQHCVPRCAIPPSSCYSEDSDVSMSRCLLRSSEGLKRPLDVLFADSCATRAKFHPLPCSCFHPYGTCSCVALHAGRYPLFSLGLP